ncbi:isoaspartyl peptidase [Longimycelium tulufanense]|uniref:Isoaspartyl peptidase n=1 Tax=Longimycelium tulufanense TaxID=907463 RepID=A0A8J3CHP8_9PSEU|nr:isoaspartyl peptidase/L-asparaginase [Longimycelium tulufanense]GGM63043.1 isoaspartyl peptidase [Longimycelium tulufanense]
MRRRAHHPRLHRGALVIGLAVVVPLVLAVPQSGAEPGPGAPYHVSAVEAAASNTQATPDRHGSDPKPDAYDVVLAVHTGAGGGLRRDTTPPEVEKAYRDGIAKALREGYALLRRGESSVAAVEAAVRLLEDNELFNAGKGAVFNTDAGHELDASIMRGSDLAAGAVAGVRNVRNPISAARLVMEKTRHVMLAGEGADDFAAANGLEVVTQDHYWTQRAWDSLMRAKKPGGARTNDGDDPQEHGTVGAVSVDRHRHLAAATSTGGLTNKMAGRVGDSPIAGAGTYAKDDTIAASATGVGEVFIRGAATATISNLVEFGGMDLARASHEVVVKRLLPLGGTGGVITLNRLGVLDATHSTPGMPHGYVTADGRIVTKVFLDETPSDR